MSQRAAGRLFQSTLKTFLSSEVAAASRFAAPASQAFKSQKIAAPRASFSSVSFARPSVANGVRTRLFSSAALATIKVPSMGDSISEGTVIKILKNVGDSIKEDEILMQLETDKVTVDVRSTSTGVITQLLAKEGETVAVGADLAKVDTTATAGAAKPAAAAAPKAEEPKKEAPKAEAPKAEAPKAAAAPAAPAAAPKAAAAPAAGSYVVGTSGTGDRGERRVPMTRMRKRIAERLKDSQNTAAMLTTFNEIDMSKITELRAQYKDEFEKKHGVKLGFMSAFVKAATVALQEQPAVNAVIDGDDILYRDYVDISVAVATPTGLLVPVIRDCQTRSFAGIEKEIGRLSEKGRLGQIAIEDMQGGTFTISNGGVFGSLFGTPIINPPQSAILGMHAINKRPVVVGDQVVIRPMMYVALTYDHRLIDGREAVTCLKKIKEMVEDPRRFVLDL